MNIALAKRIDVTPTSEAIPVSISYILLEVRVTTMVEMGGDIWLL